MTDGRKPAPKASYRPTPTSAGGSHSARNWLTDDASHKDDSFGTPEGAIRASGTADWVQGERA